MAPFKRVRALTVLLALTLCVAVGVAVAALPQQTGSVDLATQSQVRIDGAASNNVFGEQTAPAGDFNGDGYGDVVLSDGAAGFVWIVFGSAAGGNLDMNAPGTRAIKVNGIFAQSVGGGRDVNGDGLPDVVIGDGNTDT